ncbi:MAG: hypothetical protein CMF23_18110 [Ignavibacteriae bacterium]|nr:hypothetical protein [Ignavibacteriota bacterium]
MDLIKLSELIVDEKAANAFLIENKILVDYKSCFKCGSKNINLIRRGKFICYGCRHEWDYRIGSILEKLRTKSSTFIGVLKMFELEIPSYIAAKMLRINPKLSDNVYYTIRKLISRDMIEEINNKKVFEFSIKDEAGIILISNFSESKSGDKLTIKNKRQSEYNYEFSIEYQRKFKKVNSSKERNSPSLTAIFLRELNYRIRRIRKIHYKNMHLYLKETEFRFNNRNNELFWEILEEIKVKSSSG